MDGARIQCRTGWIGANRLTTESFTVNEVDFIVTGGLSAVGHVAAVRRFQQVDEEFATVANSNRVPTKAVRHCLARCPANRRSLLEQ